MTAGNRNDVPKAGAAAGAGKIMITDERTTAYINSLDTLCGASGEKAEDAI